MKITLCPTIVEACQQFASKRMEGSADLYRHRGEIKTSKIQEDIFVGALAEFAVHQYLTEKGHDCSKPDLTIHEKRQKNFNADLVTSEGFKIHVKSQTVQSASRYGASWLFQKSDRVLGTPGESSYIAFCTITRNEVDIRAIVSIIDLVEADLISSPKIPRYAMTKNAIYLDHVLNSKIDLWRF